MQSIVLMIIMHIMALTQARPHPPSNFVLWNFFPYLQQHHVQVMQQHQQVLQPVNIAHQMQYPTFEMFFNGPMPIIGEVQFQVPMEQTNAPPQAPVPPPTTTTTTTTTRRPCSESTYKQMPQTSFKQATPQVDGELMKSQLSKGIFEMARHIQANILSEDNPDHQTSKFNVFSPINVAAVLSLLEMGAKAETNQELQAILGFDNLPSSESRHPMDHHHAFGQMLESVLHPKTGGQAQINMANGIFMQTGYSLRQDYRTSVEAIYQSQVTTLDFQREPAAATKFINDWVQRQTNGKIANILEDGIDKSSRMMVASAVYFKAFWMSSFVSQATGKRPFYPNGKDGHQIMVDTMVNGGDFKYYESKAFDCGIIALPFTQDTTTMYIVLPNNSNEVKLRKLQESLTADIIEDMISKMEFHASIITLPKMHLSDTLDLKDVLSQLNVRSVFDSGNSDLSSITEHNQISLDGFVHKIDLTINETGTEGAAATATSLSRHDADVEFRVDAPFMFFVRHDATKLPIFYGSVIEPVNSI